MVETALFKLRPRSSVRSTVTVLIAATLFLIFVSPVFAADDIFQIRKIRVEEPLQVDVDKFFADKAAGKKVTPPRAHLLADFVAKRRVRVSELRTTAHFFGKGANRPVASAVWVQDRMFNLRRVTAPVFLQPGEVVTAAFPLPVKLPERWTAVVVLGDAYGAVAKAYPLGEVGSLEYPERKLVQSLAGKSGRRVEPLDPVIEMVMDTKDPLQKQLTLFLCTPPGIADGSEVEGVLALVVIASGVPELRKRLQLMENDKDYGGLYRFAKEHKLAILACGSSGFGVRVSYGQADNADTKKWDRAFDRVAAAWEAGLVSFSKRYGIPDRDVLLMGHSGAAIWAFRLALRKPERILAVHGHVAGAFDMPKEDAARLPLWLVTTADGDGGYSRCLKFYTDAKNAGYPILFKSVMGLGTRSPVVSGKLGIAFFEYALTQKEARGEMDRLMADSFAKKPAVWPWPGAFHEPVAWGDFMNQYVVPPARRGEVPQGFQVPLLTEEIRRTWSADLK